MIVVSRSNCCESRSLIMCACTLHVHMIMIMIRKRQDQKTHHPRPTAAALSVYSSTKLQAFESGCMDKVKNKEGQ